MPTRQLQALSAYLHIQQPSLPTLPKTISSPWLVLRQTFPAPPPLQQATLELEQREAAPPPTAMESYLLVQLPGNIHPSFILVPPSWKEV